MSDSKEDLICPACNEKMVKIYTHAEVNIDICLNGCGGIWFDNREIDKFSKNEENFDELQKIIKDKTYHSAIIIENRICPVCGAKMVQNQAADGIVIDECYTCGGKFLDYGELEKIKESKNIQEEKIKEIVSALSLKNSGNTYSANQSFIRKFLEKVYIDRLS